MYFVYRFLNPAKNIIYIGKTSNIDVRIKNHIDNGHLPLECYRQIDKIEYIYLNTRVEMDIAELYFINLYKPYYNKLDKEKDAIELQFKNTFTWLEYTGLDYKTILKYKMKYYNAKRDADSFKNKYYNLLGKGFTEIPNETNKPYYLRGLSERMKYITKIISKSITPIEDNKSYTYIEVLNLLRLRSDLKFRSKNKGADIKVYRQQDYIIFEEPTHVISECKDSRYIVPLNPSPTEDIGSYNLAGVVPFLSYVIC